MEEASPTVAPTKREGLSPDASANSASGAQTCTQLIRNVACDPRLVALLGDSRTLSVLTEFVMTDTSLVTRLNCSVVLAELCRSPVVCETIVDAGGVALAWSLLQVRVGPQGLLCCRCHVHPFRGLCSI